MSCQCSRLSTECKLPRWTVWHFDDTRYWNGIVRNFLFLKNFDLHGRRITVQTETCTTENTTDTVRQPKYLGNWSVSRQTETMVCSGNMLDCGMLHTRIKAQYWQLHFCCKSLQYAAFNLSNFSFHDCYSLCSLQPAECISFNKWLRRVEMIAAYMQTHSSSCLA